MQIGQHDQSRVRCNLSGDLLDINAKLILKRSRKTLNSGAKIFSDGKQRFIRRLLDQDFVAVFDCRGHRQMIGHRSAAGNRNDGFRIDPTVRCQRLNQRSITIRVVAVQIDVFDRRFKFSERKVEDAAQREIVFDLRALLGPLHVYRLSVHLSTSQPGVRVPTLVGLLFAREIPD